MAPINSSPRTRERRNVAVHAASACWIAVVLTMVIVVFEIALGAKVKTAKLDKHAINDVEYYAKELWTGTYAAYWWNTFTPDPIPEMKWYRKIVLGSEPRYDALALLLIAKPVETPIKDRPGYVTISFKDVVRCTAFYIAPDTLMTVAHCLTRKGVSKGSGHILIARQNYVAQRDKEYTKELAAKYERYVIEWIYDEAYCESTPTWSCQEAMDYAFLKIKDASHNNAHYTLATPKPEGAEYDYLSTHAGVVIAGFPSEWSKFSEPAEVEGVLHYTTDDEFKKEPIIAEGMKAVGKKMDPEILRHNQIAAVSHEKGTIGEGGSGGPWLIAEKSLTEEQKAARLKWVIGVSLWSATIPTEKDMPGKSFVERQKFSTVAVSKLFTKEFVEMAKEIAAVKNGAKTMQSVMEKHIKLSGSAITPVR